jgi:DMSO/TMAO reductase YedYZ heme-binding membrane subunit
VAGPAPVLASTALWDVSRASGTVSLFLLTGTLLLGILTWSRWRTEGWPRFLTAGLHRNVSLLAVAFVSLHVLVNVVASYVPIHLADAFVPFVSAYRPFWLGLGAVALDLVIALVATSLLRRRLGRRAWRAVHWLAYACWPVALVHALGTGTDLRAGWFVVVVVGCAGAATVAVLVRVTRSGSDPKPPRSVWAPRVGAPPPP